VALHESSERKFGCLTIAIGESVEELTVRKRPDHARVKDRADVPVD
jgi:hypothetical protein